MAATLAPAPHALAAHLDDGTVLLDLHTRSYFQLNATGAVVWQSVEARDDRTAAIARLVDAFDVAHADAATGYDALVAELRARALVVPG